MTRELGFSRVEIDGLEPLRIACNLLKLNDLIGGVGSRTLPRPAAKSDRPDL